MKTSKKASNPKPAKPQSQGETTSSRVSAISGKTLKLRQLRRDVDKSTVLLSGFDGLAPMGKKSIKLTWGDILAMAASCNTQAANRKASK